MKSILTTVGICALLTATSQIMAQENHQISSSQSKEVKATVEKVNKETREVTLKKADGTMVTIAAPETVRNFAQIKVGDIVTAKYSESVAIAVRKSDEPPSATGRQTITRAPLGDKPGAAGQTTVHISATIEKIDRDKRELTLKGPQGNTAEVEVPEGMKKFDELKEGDQVVVTATEAVAISVSSPEK